MTICLDFESAIWKNDWNLLNFLIDCASLHEAPSLVYATFVDCILASKDITATSIPPQDTISVIAGDSSNVTPIPTAIATNLLCKITSMIRAQHGYDVPQASRWIRYIVQFIIERENPLSRDRNQASSSTATDILGPNQILQLLEDLTSQAILMARESISDSNANFNTEDADDEDFGDLPSPSLFLSTLPNPNSNQVTTISPTQPRHDATNQEPLASSPGTPNIYPPLELTHLSTTLFNHALDYYVSASTSTPDPSPPTHQSLLHDLRTDHDRIALSLAKISLEIATVGSEVENSPLFLLSTSSSSFADKGAGAGATDRNISKDKDEDKSKAKGKEKEKEKDEVTSPADDNGRLVRILRERCAVLGWDV